MTPDPWERPNWFLDRVQELIWTALGTVQLAFWMTLLAVLYLAVFTDRNPQVLATVGALMPVVLGLGATYSARRVADKGIDAKWAASNGSTSEPVIFQPGADDPTA